MIYFLRVGMDGPIKIGTTNDLKGRIAGIQTNHHEELLIWRLFEGGIVQESALHTRFAEYRMRGEWFSFHEDMAKDLGLTEIHERDFSLLQKPPSSVNRAVATTLAPVPTEEAVEKARKYEVARFKVITSDHRIYWVEACGVRMASDNGLLFLDEDMEAVGGFSHDKWISWHRHLK